MSIYEDTRGELAKASADHLTKKVINRMAEEIDNISEEHREIKERLTELEEER